MSCADFVPFGSQINVSLGGKTDVCAIPVRHDGTGAMGTGLAVPCPDVLISPDNRAVAHLEGSKSPPRPRIAEGPWLKVSQNAGAFKLQPDTGGGGGGGGGRIAIAKAEHIALLPPLEPLHLHPHGPVAVPDVQRLVVGTDDTVVPLAAPHTPLTGGGVTEASSAEQLAVVPPFEPAQLQFQGPVPVTVDDVPTMQRLADGADDTVVPLANPQTALTGGGAVPAGYALFEPGSTGTPPGTSTSTMLTLELTIGWSDPSCTTLVPGTRSVIGMVTAKVRHEV